MYIYIYIYIYKGYFSIIQNNSNNVSNGVFIHTGRTGHNFNIVYIKDSIFENINVKSDPPLIDSERFELM